MPESGAPTPEVAEATVIAPAYNEAEALPAVLAALEPLRASGVDVIVVDDGSTDDTAAVAREAGVRLVRLERNQGKAEAVRRGLAATRTRKVVVIDADATYPVNAIPAIIGLLDEYDVVLGVRTEGRANIPPLNRLGNAALRTAIHWFSGFRSADPLTGLYGLRREHLEAMRLTSRGFGLEAEIGVKAARMGLRWVDLPITYAERIGESKLDPLRDGAIITWTVIRTLFSGPRLQRAPGGRGELRPAPLAVAASVLAIGLMTVGAIFLLSVLAVTIATIADPDVPHTTTGVGLAALLLLGGVALWRIVTRWGRPGVTTLAPVAAAGVAGGAAALAALVLVAGALGALAPTPASLLLRSAILGGCVLALVGVPLSWPLARRARHLRDRILDTVEEREGPVGRVELAGLALALAVLALPVVRFLVLEPIFLFDEAIYANTARSWIEGTPNTGWSQHRSPGISFLGLPAVPFGSEAAFRVLGLIAGLGIVAAGWALGRRLGGRGVAFVAALAIATIPPLVYNAGFFLTDVPSTVIVLVLMLVAWRELEERDEPTPGILWLAPLAAAAFYVRYGSSLPIAFVGLGMTVVWFDKLRRAWRLALGTAALLLILLVPHLVQSTLQTGSPIGITRMAQALAAPAYPGEALAAYLSWIPGHLGGPVGDVLLGLGLVVTPLVLGRQALGTRVTRALVFLLLPATAHFVLLGMTALPVSRYVLLPVVLFVIAGAIAGGYLARRLVRPSQQAVIAAVALVTVVTGLGTVASNLREEASRARSGDDLVDVARRVAADAGGASCGVLGYPPPQLTWYSGCAVEHFGFPPADEREQFVRGERQYLVLTVQPNARYPRDELRDDYRSLAEAEPFAVIEDVPSGEPAFEVYRLRQSAEGLP